MCLKYFKEDRGFGDKRSSPSGPETWSLNPTVPLTSCVMSGHLGHITQDLCCPFQVPVCGSDPRAINPGQEQSEILEPALAGANRSHLIHFLHFPFLFFFALILTLMQSLLPLLVHFFLLRLGWAGRGNRRSTLLKRKEGRPRRGSSACPSLSSESHLHSRALAHGPRFSQRGHGLVWHVCCHCYTPGPGAFKSNLKESPRTCVHTSV